MTTTTRGIGGRKCKRFSGNQKDVVIRIRSIDKRELQFLKGAIGLNPSVGEGEVVEKLIEMYKGKKIGQLNAGKGFNSPLEKDQSLEDFNNDKQIEETINSYEYLLQDKQHTLDSYVKYLDTACELGKLDKKQVIENVQRKQRVLKRDVVV